MRRTGLLAALLGAGAAPALAQLTEAEADFLPRVLSALHADLIAGSAGDEMVLLLASDDPEAYTADLLVLSAPPEQPGHPLVIARGIVFAGGMAGQAPWLEIAPNGSLLLRSQQIAIGRSPWEMTLTLTERQDALRVAGLTFATWDRLTAANVTCDWNLLTGQWRMQYERPPDPDNAVVAEAGSASGRQPRHALASNWVSDENVVPEFCRHEFRD